MVQKTDTARALMLHAARNMSLESVPLPDLGEDDLLLKIELCGICASDVARWKGEFLVTPPQILGHEFVGIVAAMGKRVHDRRAIDIGDRAVAEILIPCGRCPACRRGDYHLCFENDPDTAQVFGREFGCSIPASREPTALWGGFSQYLYVPEDAIVHRVDPSIRSETAVLTEPLATAVHVLHVGAMVPGEGCVVIGPGTIGLCVLVAAKHAGLGPVVVVGTAKDRPRLDIAERLGADATVVVAGGESDSSRILAPFGGDRRHVGGVFECSGSSAGQRVALSLTRKGGSVVFVGVNMGHFELEPAQIVFRELNLKGAVMSAHGYELALDIIKSGRFDMDQLLTHVCSLDATPRVLDALAEDAHTYGVKVAIDPWAQA